MDVLDYRQRHIADRWAVYGTVGLLLIVAPIVYPIAMNLGIDPIHLGIIMVVNMEIGMITPPVGLNLFVTSSITKMGILRVMQVSLPWVGILFIFLMIVTYVPQVSLFLLIWHTAFRPECWLVLCREQCPGWHCSFACVRLPMKPVRVL